MSASTVVGPVAISTGSTASSTLVLTSPANGAVLTIESVNANAVYGVYVTASVSLDGTNYGPAEVVADFPSGSGEATVNAPSASKVLVTVTNRDITPATVTVVAEQF